MEEWRHTRAWLWSSALSGRSPSAPRWRPSSSGASAGPGSTKFKLTWVKHYQDIKSIEYPWFTLPVLFQGHSLHCFPILGFYPSLGWRSGFLCTYPQFLPQCIRLQITENWDTCRQEKELWACIRNWREVCRSAWLPDGWGHVRNGGGEENRPQDDLFLRPGGLQDVQWAVNILGEFLQPLKEPHDDVSEDALSLLTFKMLLIFLARILGGKRLLKATSNYFEPGRVMTSVALSDILC